MRTRLALVLALGGLLTGWAHGAQVSTVPGPDGKPRVMLENALLRVQVDPQRGARVDGLRYGPWGEVNVLPHVEWEGLFVDHFWQENWPGQLWEARYDYQVLSAGPQEVAVRFSCLSVDKGVPQVAGVRVDKTLRMREGSPLVTAEIGLTNTTAATKYLGYWQQHVVWLGGDQAGDHYFRPSQRGVSEITSDMNNPPDGGFVREPQAGWSAAIDAAKKQGLVFFLGYNDLWFLYNCTPANTIEWQYEATVIPPGKTWTTQVSVLPISGLDRVDWARPELLLGLTMREEAGKLACGLQALAPLGELAKLNVSGELEALVSHQVSPASAVAMGPVGGTPRPAALECPYDTAKREPAVLRLRLTSSAGGPESTATGEFWYAGNMASNTNPTDGSPFYAIAGPQKQRTLLKPDVIERIRETPRRVLVVRGMLTPEYRLDPVLASWGVKADAAWCLSNAPFGPRVDDFPFDYGVLMRYDLIILSDVGADMLGPTALEMLRDYVKAGGNLLVLGGPRAYGLGGGREQGEGLLPVRLVGPFDLKAAPRGGALTVLTAAGADPAVQGLRFPYVHRVETLPDARVWARVGEWPLTVSARRGAGTVTCFLGTPLGQNHPCDSAGWRVLLAEMLTRTGLRRGTEAG